MDDKTQQKENKEAKVLDDEAITIIIPKCCVEGLPTCPHVAQRVKPSKRNVGL